MSWWCSLMRVPVCVASEGGTLGKYLGTYREGCVARFLVSNLVRNHRNGPVTETSVPGEATCSEACGWMPLDRMLRSKTW